MRQSLLWISLAAATCGVAYGQTPAPAPGDTKPITLTLTLREVEIVGRGLGLLPYGEVASLFVKLQGQIASQQGAPQAAAEKPK